MIASTTIGRVYPHLNLGYALRSGDDESQAQWNAGADERAFDWLTLAVDFLGYHDDKCDGINDDVFQSAVGVKVNPFDQAVCGRHQLPVPPSIATACGQTSSTRDKWSTRSDSP